MKSNTIAAIATPMTNSGIGIIRISGDEALDIIEKVFKPKKKDKKIKDVKTYTAHYGHVYDESTLLDECIVLVMKGPHSYTAEDVVEINCHGGVVVMKKVLEAVFKAGANPGGLKKTRLLDSEGDQMQAENGVQSAVFENGALRIEYAAGCAYLDGEELHLTPIEYKLLCLLSQNAGKVLTHTFITQKIWGSSWENDIASLRVFMATLRKKLEKNGEQTQYIQTHIGVGYRMLKVE